MSFKITDWEGREITVGTRVTYGSPPEDCVVFKITEPDGDYDDELGRAVEITPKVYVRFDNGDEEWAGTYNDTKITWADYPDGPEESIYVCDDLESVIVNS